MDQIRDIFETSQHLHRHQKCIKQLQDFYQQKICCEGFRDQFVEEFGRDVLLTLNSEPKSPYTRHTIEFVAKYLQSFSIPKEVLKESNSGSDSETTVIDEEMAAEYETSADKSGTPDENRRPSDECQDSEECDELGIESFGSESFITGKSRDSRIDSMMTTTMMSKDETNETELTFLDIFVKEKLIRYLNNSKTHIRYNCCFLIRKLFTDLEDIDFDVYKKLKKSLLERLRDKDKLIRSAAALALHRFQEVDVEKDLVSDALKFHLNYDPDFRVRQSCLLSLHPNVTTIDDFISSTRDVKDIIRKTAFTIITDKFDVKNFGIGKRLQILKNGLNERHSAVRKVVETRLIPQWVKSYEGDFIQFLYGLDLQSDPELIERMLFLYFDHLNEDSDDSSEKTAFHKYLEDFRNRFLEDFNLLTKEEMSVENSFLWCIVAKYCKERNITIIVVTDTPIITNEEIVNTDSQPVQQNTVETVDAIDTIVPDLPHYCRFLTVFIRHLLETDSDLHQLMEYEFMLRQLLSMGELLDIIDEAQRQILCKFVLNLLENRDLFEKAHNFIPHLMKIFAKNSDLTVLLETTVNTIDKINSEAMDVEMPEEPTPVVESQPVALSDNEILEQLRHLDVENAKLSVRLEALNDDYESAVKEGNIFDAQKINELIDSLKSRISEVLSKRNRLLSAPDILPSQSSQNEAKPQETLTVEDPIARERCLQIFCGCLEFGDFKSLNPIIITLVENLVIKSITSPEIRIRCLAIKALGLVCLIASDFAKKYFLLFVQVLNFDAEEAQEIALKCIFDILCFHGLSLFEEKPKQKSSQSFSMKSISSEQNSKQRNSYRDMNDSEEELNDDNDKTIIGDDNEILCSESEVEEEEEDSENFITIFTDLLENNLNSESDSIKFITLQGIGKLFILGRMYSPQLLSKMLILWYDNESTQQMKQFLGAFFPIYSGVQMKANLKGENAFEECFIKTVEMVFEEGLNYVNLDNLINFVLELISDDGHKTLAKAVANQILNRIGVNGVDDILSNKYYLRVLSALRLTEMSSHDIKEYKLLIEKINKKLNRLKNKTKLTSNRLQTIKTKIEKQIETIKENASQVSTIEGFGSLSLSQGLSDSLSERSQIDETIIDTNI